jgi:hypothetical protein
MKYPVYSERRTRERRVDGVYGYFGSSLFDPPVVGHRVHKDTSHLIATTTQTVGTRTVQLMQGLSKDLLSATTDAFSRFASVASVASVASLLLALLLRLGCITKTQKRTKNQIRADSVAVGGSPGLSAIFSMTSTHTNLDWDSSTLHPCFADPLLDRTNFQDSDVSSTPRAKSRGPLCDSQPSLSDCRDTDAAIEEMT